MSKTTAPKRKAKYIATLPASKSAPKMTAVGDTLYVMTPDYLSRWDGKTWEQVSS